MPVMTKFARIAPAGLLRYRGSAFGHGNLFTAQFNSHRVQRHKVSRNGATYQTEDEDFLVSSDPDLHPTDVMQDNDGSMVVVDTGAWFIHGCPLSRTAKVSERDRCTGFARRMRSLRLRRRAPPMGCLPASVRELWLTWKPR